MRSPASVATQGLARAQLRASAVAGKRCSSGRLSKLTATWSAAPPLRADAEDRRFGERAGRTCLDQHSREDRAVDAEAIDLARRCRRPSPATSLVDAVADARAIDLRHVLGVAQHGARPVREPEFDAALEQHRGEDHDQQGRHRGDDREQRDEADVEPPPAADLRSRRAPHREAPGEQDHQRHRRHQIGDQQGGDRPGQRRCRRAGRVTRK